MTAEPVLFRVERGQPTPEELAALACVLLRTAAGPGRRDSAVRPASWRRPDRAPAFRNPRTWQASPR